jgi:ubiquinone/menaquinone biosynthesis C-methylase UbiE
VLLADELAEGRGSQPLRERRDLPRVLVGGVGEEVAHEGSMLTRVTGSVADSWSGASYERIAETFAPIHDRVVAVLAIAPGLRVLDVACGTGGVALRAARAGAQVVGIDISADQLAKAREAANAEGLEIRLDEGDCQELPYADAEFDAVASVFGAIFAPDHERAAAELARVCRPGGRLALTAWKKDAWSDIHAKAGRPITYEIHSPRWAEEEHVRGLLGEAFELELQPGTWRIKADSGEELWELVSSSMPPLHAWLASADDEARAHAERVYLDYLASGVFERSFVYVLGERR